MKSRAEYPDHVWSYDFAMDATEDSRRLRVMPVVDEYSRECLALKMECSITSEEVVDTLRRLFTERGAPKYIRSDNGLEFVARALKRWLAVSRVGTLYIEPGAPWENAFYEKAKIVKSQRGGCARPRKTVTTAPLLHASIRTFVRSPGSRPCA